MGDFHQNGSVTTLHNLGNRSVSEIEAELKEFAKVRPMGLILPSLYSEIHTKALPQIIEELKGVGYLSNIVVGLDRASKDEYKHALEFFSHLPQDYRVLWNDGPRLRAIDAKLAGKGLSPSQEGKGRNVWFCMGYMLAQGKAQAIALHDCDILTYDRGLLARLIYPVANPRFGYQFSKGYYPRVAEGKLNGRVTRLLMTPLIRSLEQVVGPMDYLRYLDGFRYPLAGEFSFRREVMPDIRLSSDWGLEVGVLSEMHRNYALNKICQVDISDCYDHKHQDVSHENAEAGLSKMSIDIVKLLFRKLATMGVVFSPAVFRSLKAAYFRNALDFVEMYKNDALINGLKIDVHAEEMAVELFAENILSAGDHFLEKPMEMPFIHSWSRVVAAFPNIYSELLAAVEADTKEFSGM